MRDDGEITPYQLLQWEHVRKVILSFKKKPKTKADEEADRRSRFKASAGRTYWK